MTDIKSKSEDRALYPSIMPYETGFLDVGDGHRLYWEVSGNRHGIPVVFLHGGPGSGTHAWQRTFFDPEKYRIILFDQRGCGQSTPHARLEYNTTAHLVSDMELLRVHLGVEQWTVFGGSWGSTLALAYADIHSHRVSALVMYGIFLARKSELHDLYYSGGIVSKIFSDVFEPYIKMLPPEKRAEPIDGYKDLFHSPDLPTRMKALDLWTRLEKRISRLVVTEDELQKAMSDPQEVLAHSLIENHYFLHHGFVNGDELLRTLGSKLVKIPVHIVQGRYDMVCPVTTAFELHRAIPTSQLSIVEDVGHSAQEPKLQRQLVDVMDELARTLEAG